MATISKTTSRTKRPVIVTVPAPANAVTLSLEEAQSRLRRAGGKAMTKEEIVRFQTFQKQ